MLTDERKAVVDGLSDDELEFEVTRGRASRFQGDLYDYARAQLVLRKEAKQAATDKAALEVGQANVKATKQNRNATHITWVVALAVGVALVLAQCLGTK